MLLDYVLISESGWPLECPSQHRWCCQVTCSYCQSATSAGDKGSDSSRMRKVWCGRCWTDCKLQWRL